MTWARVEGALKDSAYGELKWSDWLPGRCDPYLVWADLSTRRAICTAEDPLIPVLLQLSDARAWPAKVAALPTHFRAWGRSKYVSTMVDPSSMVALFEASRDPCQAVVRFEFVGARTTSIPSRLKGRIEDFLKGAKSAATACTFRIRPLSDRERNRLRRRQLEQAHRETGTSTTRLYRRRAEYVDVRDWPLLCVIDDGFGFLASSLWNKGGPWARSVIALRKNDVPSASSQDIAVPGRNTTPALQFGPAFDFWRHSPTPTLPNGIPTIPLPDTFRGAALAQQIDLIAMARTAADGEEAVLLRELEALGLRRRWSHGSAVLGQIVRVLARVDPTLNQTAPLMLAQLPPSFVEDTSGGSLSGVALDAIHDALDVQEDETYEPDARGADPPIRPLIVNLSYGHHSGAHDGTSMFESAVEELLAQNPQLQVVVPAGNSHLQRAHAGGHVGEAGQRLHWQVLPANPADAFMELWFREPERVKVTVTPPGGTEGKVICRGQAYHWSSDDSGTAVLHAAAIFPAHVPQGNHGSMLLLAVAPTDSWTVGDPPKARQDRPVRRPSHGRHGTWTIDIERIDDKPELVNFDAWVQRGDVAPGRRQSSIGVLGRQGRFLDPFDRDRTPPAVGPEPQRSLNGIATLHRPGQFHAIGASRRLDGSLALYSAAGPGRDAAGARLDGPDWVVPGDESRALNGLLSTGMLGSSRVRVGGTSMAAAVFSAYLFEQAARGRALYCQEFPVLREPSREPCPTAGAPERAPAIMRGECRRIDPDEFPWIRHRPTT